MTPERWERLKPLFASALEMPAGQRPQFVAQAGELRQDLEALLAANDEETRGSFDAPFIDFHNLGRKQAFHEGDLLLRRFRIVRRLGHGGMGEVYEAEDTRLQKVHVALKTILSNKTGDEDLRARFEREVLLAREVSHPNLCPMYDIFECEEPPPGFLFLTMKLLPGTDLAERLDQTIPVSTEDGLAILTKISQGLVAIHEAGIVHRDIKPKNIMLDGTGPNLHLWITDFGLARAYQNETTVSGKGSVAGTFDYIAPELFLGHMPSQASDLFAFGVVLHEVFTGEKPTAAAKGSPYVLSARLAPPNVPASCVNLITECLSHDPRRRCEAFAEALEAIDPKLDRGLYTRRARTIWIRRRFAGAAAAGFMLLLSCLLLIPAVGERVRGILFSSSEKHIAVLPLDFVGADSETQALGDGVMDSLAGKLANLDPENQSLFVVPASEVRSRKVTDPSSALREFGATIVVKGSFERNQQAARLRLTVIDPKKTREIGYVDVDSPSGDLADLQDEAVTRLGRLMNISVKGDPLRSPGEPATRAAYEDYLAGLGYFQRSDKPGNIELAITSLQDAVKTNPSFALGFARLAQVYTMKSRLTSNPEWLQQAEAYGKQAVKLDHQIPSAYVALGQIHEFNGNHDLAVQEFQRAINLDPREAEAIAGLANSYKNAGRNANAEAAYIKAASLRPNDWKGYNDLGNFYESIGRPRDAIAQFNRALELTPDNSWLYTNLGLSYMDFDDPKMLEQAEKALKKSIMISPTFGAYSNLGFLYAQEHRFEDSVAANQAALKLNDQNYDVWDNLTASYEWLKQDKNESAAREKTMELAEQAVKHNPQNAAAQAKLAALYAKSGARQKAIDKIRISLDLSPDNQYVLSQVADSYESLGNRREAIKYLERAMAQGLSREQLSEDPEIQAVISDPIFTTSKK